MGLQLSLAVVYLVVTQDDFISLVLPRKERGLGLEACLLLGSVMMTLHQSVSFKRWPVTSLPWNWVREQRSREAFVSSEEAVRAGSWGFMN